MPKEPQEYSLEALIEHPVLRLQMAVGGLERRYLDLILDAGGLRRVTDADRDAPTLVNPCP